MVRARTAGSPCPLVVKINQYAVAAAAALAVVVVVVVILLLLQAAHVVQTRQKSPRARGGGLTRNGFIIIRVAFRLTGNYRLSNVSSLKEGRAQYKYNLFVNNNKNPKDNSPGQ